MMSETVLEYLQRRLTEVVAKLIAEKAPGAPTPQPLDWEAPKNPEFGDLSTSVALRLAKPMRSNPLALAEILAEAFRAEPLLERVNVAKPGFVNAALSRAAVGRMLGDILEQKEAFGRTRAGDGKAVLVEFVSANPTGPMHVGHARHAAVGDSIARILEAAGWKTHREFYINDAGNQVRTLGRSLRTRVLQLLGDTEARLPEDGYPGDYLLWYAWDFLKTQGGRLAEGVAADDLFGGADAERFKTSDKSDASTPSTPSISSTHADAPAPAELRERSQRAQNVWIARANARLVESRGVAAVEAARGEVEALAPEAIAAFGKACLLAMIQGTLADLRVRFDDYFSESSLYATGATEAALDELTRAGATFKDEGATWLRTTAKGDDKDRVLVKSDGTYTYLVPDIAYHLDKLRRPRAPLAGQRPDMLVNLFGSDHDGYQARLKAGVAFCGHDPDALQILIMRLVFLVRGGERLDMGKRSGNFVSARDLLDDVGCDVLRYFMLQRGVNTEFNFDLDLAREHSDRNPVFKIQYAHARACSVLRKADERGMTWRGPRASDAEQLVAAEEKDIVRELARLPEAVNRAAATLEPQHIATYLLGLAELFNRYWSLAKVDEEYRMLSPDAPERTQARLSLVAAFRIAVANGLRLLGIDAPERMVRETEKEEEE